MCVSACLSVCVCVSVPLEIFGMGRRIATLLTLSLKSFASQVAQTAFWAYTTRGSRENAFASFSPVPCTPNPVHTPLHFRLPWAGWILPTTMKLLQHFGRVIVKGHALHITGIILAIAFTSMGYRYSMWTGYSYFANNEWKDLPVREWVRLVYYNNTRILCVYACVCLWHLRSRKQDMLMGFFRHHKELCLASCTNCFLIVYDMWFQKKGLGTLSQDMFWWLCTHLTLLVTLGRMNPTHCLIAVGTFLKIRQWGTSPSCVANKQF